MFNKTIQNKILNIIWKETNNNKLKKFKIRVVNRVIWNNHLFKRNKKKIILNISLKETNSKHRKLN